MKQNKDLANHLNSRLAPGIKNLVQKKINRYRRKNRDESFFESDKSILGKPKLSKLSPLPFSRFKSPPPMRKGVGGTLFFSS